MRAALLAFLAALLGAAAAVQASPPPCVPLDLAALDERLDRIEALVWDLHTPSPGRNIHQTQTSIEQDLYRVANEYRIRSEASIVCR